MADDDPGQQLIRLTEIAWQIIVLGNALRDAAGTVSEKDLEELALSAGPECFELPDSSTCLQKLTHAARHFVELELFAVTGETSSEKERRMSWHLVDRRRAERVLLILQSEAQQIGQDAWTQARPNTGLAGE
jgi:hypothetical protein